MQYIFGSSSSWFPGQGTDETRSRNDVRVRDVIQQPTKGLPKIHLNNVSGPFSEKLKQCKTTPVPSVGSYGIPFPTMIAVHIFQDNDTTLKIISFQVKPSDQVNSCINLHHVLFPNYNKVNDPGERMPAFVAISAIKVNGEERNDIPQQKVHVHDGRFSPPLPTLVHLVGDEYFSISATVALPEIPPTHLYSGFSEIKMLNIISPEGIARWMDDGFSLEHLQGMIAPSISMQIDDLLDKNS
jgi:hypothetical protein